MHSVFRCSALLVALLAPNADADEPKRPPPKWHPPTRTAFEGENRVRHIFQPEFRPASELLAELDDWMKGRKGYEQGVLTAQLVLPRVVPLPTGPRQKPGAPVHSRILLAGPRPQLAEARNVLARFDAPTRGVSVSVLLSEVSAHKSKGSGANLLYDKDGVANPGSTLYRGTALDFDPDAYLASTVTGVRPFEGTTLTFGDDNTLGGSWEWTLRMLSKRGEAHFLGWPNLMCVEGRPAEMSATESLPQPQVRVSNGNPTIDLTSTREVGVRLRVTPVRVADDHAVLDLDLWFRIAEPSEEPNAPVSQLNLRSRQVTTRVTVRDREPLLIGGLHLRRNTRNRRGLPRLEGLSLVDALLSARDSECIDTELLVLVRARIVTPRPARGLTTLSDDKPLEKQRPPLQPCCAEPLSEVEREARGPHDPWRDGEDTWRIPPKLDPKSSGDLGHPPAVGRERR